MSDDVLKMSVDRGFTWMEDETLALIEIWSAEEVQRELNNAKRNFCVYERIAKELAQVGFSRTAYQCREKIKRLRKEYQVAHYCVLHNLSQKKPMKYYDLVDQVFSKTPASYQNTDSRNSGLCSSDQEEEEDELQFTFDPDSREDFSNNDSTLTMTVSSKSDHKTEFKIQDELKSEGTKSPICSNDSDETLVGNDRCEEVKQDGIELYDKEDTLDETVSPWVPNVVLVENDDENKDFHLNTTFGDSINDSKSVLSHKGKHQREPFPDTADEEPTQKKRKCDLKATWFKSMMDKVTDKFLCYQESADARFLERIVLLERERIKKDEAMQKLWIEFEERRRKEEQQHELQMMSLFSQFLNQLLGSVNVNSS